MLAQWPEADHELINGDAEAEMEWLNPSSSLSEPSAVSRISPGRRVRANSWQHGCRDSARVTRHTQALAKLAKVASITIAKSGEEQPPH